MMLNVPFIRAGIKGKISKRIQYQGFHQTWIMHHESDLIIEDHMNNNLHSRNQMNIS